MCSRGNPVAMSGPEPALLEHLLLGNSTAPPAELCRGVIRQAAERLRAAVDHDALMKDVWAARLILSHARDSGEGRDDDLGAAAAELLQDVCLPYLDVLLEDCATGSDAVQEVAETVAVALQSSHLSAAVAEEVLREGLCSSLTKALATDSAEKLDCLTTFLCVLFSRASPDSLEALPGCSEQLSAMFPLLLSLLNRAPPATIHILLFSLLPLFITPSHPHHLSAVWGMVGEVWRGQRLVELHPLVFLLSLLCCFSDVLISRDHASPFLSVFPPVVCDLCPLLDVRGEAVFWEVLGAGLRSADPLDRKRAMFLLDRVLLSVREGGGEVVSEGGVFWWRAGSEAVLSEVWKDLVLLLHTMEEKQVHIVKPVKSRMKTLARATTTFVDGLSVLHVSWLELALGRVFVHSEARSIVRWGVCEALSLDLVSSPFLLPAHWQFVCGPLLTALCNSRLYSRHSTSELRPTVAVLLTSFLERFLSQLSPPALRGEFLHGLLLAIEASSMSDVPLLHITHSLSLLCPAPLLSPLSLQVLRSIISRLDTLRHLLRTAVTSFLITAAANLSDMSQGIGWQEVASLLGGVQISTCLPFSSPAWRKVCAWASTVSAVSVVPVSTFLVSSLASLLDPLGQEAGPGYAPLSLLLLLAVDAQLLSGPSLEKLLQPVISVLLSACSRPYLSPHTLILSLSTLNSLLSIFLSGSSLTSDFWQGSQSDTGRLLYKALLPWLPDVIQTTQGLLLRGSLDGQLSLSHLTLLTSSLSSLHSFSSLYGFSWSADISPTHLMRSALSTLHLVLSSADEVLELTSAVVGAFGVVGWVSEADIDLPPSTLSSLLSLPPHLSLARPPATRPGEAGPESSWGPLVDWCEAQHWAAMRYCLRHTTTDSGGEVRGEGCRCEPRAVWELCAESVEIVSSHRLPCLLDCLSLALPSVETCQLPDTVRECWRSVRESLSSLPSFLRVLLHPHLLLSCEPALEALVEELCGEVLELGERRAGVANVLALGLCDGWWAEWERGGIQSLLRHRKLVLQLSCFGGVGRRSMRSQEEGEQFVRSLGDSISANCATAGSSDSHTDSGVRATVLSFLVGVASRDDSSHFLSQFSKDIIDKISDLSASKPRYFINSLTHRIKQRLLQTLLLLLPHLPREGDEQLLKAILQAMQSDNQTSVRHLLEWSTTLLLARQPHLIPSLLLPALQPESEFRLSRLQSLFSVVLHLSRAWSPPERLSYCRSLLPLVFPWTTSHHFVVRLYAQKTVEVLWEAEGPGENPILDSCIHFMRQHSDAAKFSEKLQGNVGFSVVRPLSDLSVQALFDYLPRLCGMVESECVRVDDFLLLWERWGRKEVPLYCDNSDLREMVERGGVGGGEGTRGDDTRSIAHQLVGSTREEEKKGDVQKKITRWVGGAGVLEELFPGLRLPREQRGPSTGGLVVVASLLTKIPNLGGLCRTCEIFGVSQLVVASLAVLEEPQFTALSVSAQHWLNISEVSVPQLPSYLLAMRHSGYRLVGAEQTAQSKSVNSYSFQPLTLLLLGNEREGIPVQLLQLLDESVEIPQSGVIRSLNVHVSGALLVWEYCRQHLLTPTPGTAGTV